MLYHAHTLVMSAIFTRLLAVSAIRYIYGVCLPIAALRHCEICHMLTFPQYDRENICFLRRMVSKFAIPCFFYFYMYYLLLCPFDMFI